MTDRSLREDWRGTFQIIFGVIVIPILIYMLTSLQDLQVTSATQAEQIKGVRAQLRLIISYDRYTQQEARADFELRDERIRALDNRIKRLHRENSNQ